LDLGVKNSKELAAGLMFLAIGAFIVYVTSGYDMGTARRMGPGYFPMGLGLILCVIALIMVGRSLVRVDENSEPSCPTLFELRVVGAVLFGSLLFAFLIKPAGLLTTVAAMVLVGSFAMRGYGWLAALLSAAALSIGSVIVFIWLLGQPMQVIGPLFRF